MRSGTAHGPVRIYLQPRALSQGTQARAAVDAGRATWLAGGSTAFSFVSVAQRPPGGAVATAQYDLPGLRTWLTGPSVEDGTAPIQWRHLTESRQPFAGLASARGPSLMGIVNVTPDSFSDGGDLKTTEQAIARGIALAEAGADLVDVGGESTRPGAAAVAPDEECRRVVPIVAALAERGLRVSIDTRRATVIAAAIAAGATVINDVNALRDADSLQAAARSGADIVLMHMQGEPRNMQNAPRYADPLFDVYDFLEDRIETCLAAGISRARLCLDPGIGFGKTVDHNLALIDGLATFHGLGCPLMLGASRKSFIAHATGESAPKARLPGSLAAALAARDRGAQILRVHDVAETRQALATMSAISRADA